MCVLHWPFAAARHKRLSFMKKFLTVLLLITAPASAFAWGYDIDDPTLNVPTHNVPQAVTTPVVVPTIPTVPTSIMAYNFEIHHAYLPQQGKVEVPVNAPDPD